MTSGFQARKKIVKELKEGVVALAIGEHTHMLLLAIFDCVDDTVIVQKVSLTWFGRRFSVHLICPSRSN